MVQVFENVLENALQHSPRGAAVVVEAAELLLDNRHWLECRICDSGPGLPEEDIGRIFEPFFTRRRGGTGLGLSIVRRIVDQHGGRVFAENRSSGGSCVTVRLPRPV
jgi:signal transduction histidine kinase